MTTQLKNLLRALACSCAFVCTSAYAADAPAPAPIACPAPEAANRPPLYILPLFEHMDVTNKDLRFLLSHYLDALEPGGPKGQVQLGYGMSVMPYHFMSHLKTGWKYNPEILDRMLKAALEINRPFVMGFTGNHFQGGGGELITELMQDPQNLMHYRDGSVPDEGYFGAKLVPFVISNDESVPAMRMKFEVLRGAAKQLYAFNKKHPGLLVGISLNGETHYLFKDFFGGTGNFDAPPLTDFGEHAIKDFQNYLDEKKIKLAAKDILNIPFTQFETGYIPVSGWLEKPQDNQRVVAYVDDISTKEISYGLNRMDVYEVVKISPNSGFQSMLDVSNLAPGKHRIDVVIETDGKPTQKIATRTIEILNAPATAAAAGAKTEGLADLPTIKIRGYMDLPKDDTKIAYIPLAREWMLFREHMVSSHISKMADILHKAGFKPEQIYSYQLTPPLIGSWNPLLFGVGDDFFHLPGLRPGVNLYGGNMLNPKLFDMIDKAKGYGVPETHPQMEGAPDYSARALNFHYCNGAVFMSPYFMNVEKGPGTSDHDKMMISPKATRWGSADYYKAIEDLVKH